MPAIAFLNERGLTLDLIAISHQKARKVPVPILSFLDDLEKILELF